ncbi:MULTISPECIES: hypothetical protein [Asaia]|uniref:hypothetical protein n=1 Tax=Asaia TaxID=91914 RepID=UPI0025545159|nr:hypothetical protein [Asaia sp. HumB]MDL2171822.1 hypothetical protein [Asaia sp. HumB]
MRDTLRAMRLYASPIFLRENPMVLLGLLYAVICYGIAVWLRLAPPHVDGLPMLVNLVMSAWWVLLLSAFSSVNTHYWRQIRSPVTFMLPRLQHGEYCAVHAIIAIAFTVLCAPPLLMGAPLLNTLSVEALALALWSGADQTGPKSMRRATRIMRRIVSRIGFILLLVPKIQLLVFTAPWPVALGLLLAGLGIALYEYRFRDYRLDPLPETVLVGRDHFPRLLQPVISCLMWRPSFLPHIPLQDQFLTTRPVIVALVQIGGTLIFAALSAIMLLVMDGHLPTIDAFRHSLPGYARQATLLVALGLCQKFQKRTDWPFLVALCPFGDKAAFTRKLLQLHLMTAVFAGGVSGLWLGLVSWYGKNLPLFHCLTWGLAAGILLVGTVCVPCLGLLSARLNRPAVNMVLTISGVVIVLQACTALMIESAFWWRGLLPLGAIVVVALLYIITPHALARQDWPLEPPR